MKQMSVPLTTDEIKDLICVIESLCYEHDGLNWDRYPEDYKKLIGKLKHYLENTK